MHQQNISREVNIPYLNSAQMHQMSVGLKDLLEDELNPMLDDHWNGCLVFEGGYEESMHRIRENITPAIEKDPRCLYSEKRVNVKQQIAREQSAETIINLH
jgi:hypothetical protein